MAEPQQAVPDVVRRRLEGSGLPRDRPVSRLQLGKNFSYPRPDGQQIRHESANSTSSINSTGSLPSMTDSSDSDASADDDYHYNTSASELWDSFWPVGKGKTQRAPKSQAVANPPPQAEENFSLDYYTTSRVKTQEDDAVTITRAELDAPEINPSQWPLPKPSLTKPPRPSRSTVNYSVYPKPTPLPTRITQLPPRVSSLTPEPYVRSLKGSKSIANLKTKPALPSVHLTPPSATDSTRTSSETIKAQRPAALTIPPQKLRSSVSAHNIRDKSQYNENTPFSAVPVPPIPDPLRSAPPHMERFVSVFDFDSDGESTVEHDTFAKRLARGLQHKKSLKELGSKKSDGHLKGHKKSASEKSTLAPDKKPTILDGSGGSLGRKRGGSLGRMLGFKK